MSFRLWRFVLMYITVLLCVHKQRTLTAAHSPLDEDKLLKNLTQRYNKNIRPVRDSSKPIDIAFDITFNYIIDVDEKQQIMISSVWIRQEWYNELLTWDPKEYGGMTVITMSAQEVWVPDIVLYNNVFEEFDGRFDNVNTLINLNYTGYSSWMAPFVFRTSCKINVANFPFDRQKCKLQFGSWAFAINKINMVRMQNRTHALQATKKVENGEWELVEIPIERNVIKYQCCPYPYVDITFQVHLRRRYLFYIINLVIPNFLITLLAFLSFLIPVDSGERVSFVITVLLSMTVFLLLVAETIPATSDAVPVIGIYFTSSIIQVALALIATAIALRIHHSHVFGRRALSPRMKVFILGTLGPWVGFKPAEKPCKETSVEIENDRSCVSCMRFFSKMKKRSNYSNSYDTCVKKSSAVKHEKVFPNSIKIQELTSEEKDEKEAKSPTYNKDNKKLSLCFDASFEETTVYENVNFIAKMLQEHKETEIHSNECKLAAAIVDRTFMLLFVVIFLFSSCIILMLPAIKNT